MLTPPDRAGQGRIGSCKRRAAAWCPRLQGVGEVEADLHPELKHDAAECHCPIGVQEALGAHLEVGLEVKEVLVVLVVVEEASEADQQLLC